MTEAAAGPQEENEVIVAGDLKIDRTARRVFIRGVEKTFTTKEFVFCSSCIKNPNHVFLMRIVRDLGNTFRRRYCNRYRSYQETS